MYHLDGWGFDGAPFMQWVMDCCYWVVQVVLRPEQTKGFVLLKKRWVVERTFTIYQSQLDFDTGKLYLIRVFINTTLDPAIVVTVYRTSQIQKYWSQS